MPISLVMKRSDINLLIVEDDRSFGKVLKEFLSKTGMNVLVSTSPDDALNKCRVQPIHLILADCMLPKMNGIDFSLEARKTQFDQNPIILMTGIFKELAFENESLSKTGAVSFLRKPFQLKDLDTLVHKALEGLLAVEVWSLKSLLARRLKSVRDRLKIIETLEKISGLDSPMILSIISDAKVSGHLNIVTQDSHIFGITFSKGLICAFDSDDADRVTVEYLKEKAYLSQEDWEEFCAIGEKRAILNKLVVRGYVSPHALEEAKKFQIQKELSNLITFNELQISFVPDESIEPMGGVDFIGAFASFEHTFHDSVNLPFFHSLYQDYWDAPIRLNAPGDQSEEIWVNATVGKFPNLRNQLTEGMSLSRLIAEKDVDELEMFRAIHALVLHRIVLFDDLQKTKNAEASLERVSKLHRDLKELNSSEVFSYFGAAPRASIPEIEKIFKAFSSSNHPDRLSADSSPEVKKISQEVYDLVQKARDVLTNETSREVFFTHLKDEEQVLRSKADTKVEEGRDQLRRGQASQALKNLEEAYGIYPSPKIYCLMVWAEIKVKANTHSQSRLVEILNKLDGFSPEEKKDPYFLMAMGLAKRASGDHGSAVYFEKALVLDSKFVEARRELNSIQIQSSGAKFNKPIDFLKGDITELVSQIFRKKSG